MEGNNISVSSFSSVIFSCLYRVYAYFTLVSARVIMGDFRRFTCGRGLKVSSLGKNCEVKERRKQVRFDMFV